MTLREALSAWWHQRDILPEETREYERWLEQRSRDKARDEPPDDPPTGIGGNTKDRRKTR